MHIRDSKYHSLLPNSIFLLAKIKEYFYLSVVREHINLFYHLIASLFVFFFIIFDDYLIPFFRL